MPQRLSSSVTLIKSLLYFLFRQIYRIFLIIPFSILVAIIEVFFGKFFNNKAHNKTKYCFIITSVIYTKQKELSYANTRSVYNPEERALQTLQTIASIKEKIPEAKIVLVESGLRKELPQDLSRRVDQYLYVGDNFLARRACDSKFKSLGEAVMLLVAMGKIEYNAAVFFKISGRYFLDNSFNIISWQSDLFRFFYIRKDYVSTRLYSFGKEFFFIWRFALIKGIPLLFLDYPIEHILPRFIPKKYILPLEKVGVMGNDATNGKIVKE
jgi:hypothetical protein